MRLKGFFLSLVVAITSAQFLFAGAPFQCPAAVSSVHGNALAVVHDTIEWKGQTGNLLSSQFTVMSKAALINDSQRISTPVTYWGDWPWSVVLDMTKPVDRSFSFCAVPLITDDAQFMILLATGPVFRSALRIYHRGDSREQMEGGTIKGVLVREVKLDELWPAERIEKFWTDGTPEWFAGGRFDFTDDNLQLIHKTRWGDIVRIHLADGKVTK